MCAWVCAPLHRDQKQISDPLELKLQVFARVLRSGPLIEKRVLNNGFVTFQPLGD